MKVKKIKKIILNKPPSGSMRGYSPLKAYRCSPGDVLDVRYPDGTSVKAVAVLPPTGSTVTHECHERHCMFNKREGWLCQLDTMFCYSKRPHVLFKPIEDVLEDI